MYPQNLQNVAYLLAISLTQLAREVRIPKVCAHRSWAPGALSAGISARRKFILVFLSLEDVGCPKEGTMKLPGLSTRALSIVLASFCLAFLIYTPAARAQAPAPTSYLQLTPATSLQVGSAWYTNPGEGGSPQTQPLASGFSTTFKFQLTPGTGADGFAFVVQNGGFAANGTMGVLAVGPSDGQGGEIGFTGLANSVAVQFDLYYNSGYNDIAASSGPTTTDQITVESCGAAANTVNHTLGCQFGTVDLSTLAAGAIFLGDGNLHTAQITYMPPSSSGSCTPSTEGFSANTGGCGSLAIVLDSRPVLTVPFNLAYLGLDANGDAYVGFTAATGADDELQNILSWTFGASGFSYPPFPTSGATGLQTNGSSVVVVIQPVSTSEPTTSTFNPTTLVQETLNFVPASNNLQCNTSSGGQSGMCPTNLELVSSNSLVPSNGAFGSYVIGTPFSTAQCLGRPGNGANNPCSLYVNACFGGNISQAQADDFYCPSVNSTGVENGEAIYVLDTWDPIDPKPNPSSTPGTTFSSMVFVPSSAGETWSPSNTSPNPVCPNPDGTSSTTPTPPATNFASGGKGCDFSDSLIEAYGDQTTTRGKVPKKGWIMSVSNVYEPLSNVSANGVAVNSAPAYNPGFSASLWFKPPINLSFVVNPACPLVNTWPCAAAGSSAYNFFHPAPVAGENYAVTTLSGGSVIPLTPATPPSGFNTQTVAPVTFTATPTLSDGQYYLQYSASDNVGIDERSIQVVPATGSAGSTTCPVPADAGGGTVSGEPQETCYITLPFESQLNVDGTPPGVTQTGFSPAGNPGGTFYVGETVYPLYSCTDPVNGGVDSGIYSCAGVVVSGCPQTVSRVQGTAFTASTSGVTAAATATDCAGNVSAKSNQLPYTVAPSVNLQINTIPLLTLPVGVPGLIPVALGAAITNTTTGITADDVTVVTTFTVPSGSGIVLGTPSSATISTVTCANTPCTLRNTTLTTVPCNVASWPMITCSVASLGPISSKTGLWMEIIVPVAKNSKTGQFTSKSVVSSAGVDLNTSNSITQTYKVIF
jgi:Bacterial lectin